MEKTFNTPQKIGQSSFTDRDIDKVVATKEIEIIPASPSSEIILKEEEIPPLDVFTIPNTELW